MQAESLKALCVGMPGASIAIDDCYELWESGFVSIPYNFELRDLRPQLLKLLQGSTMSKSNSMSSEKLLDNDPGIQQDDTSAKVGSSGSEWEQIRHHMDELPAMKGSASADTAASLTAEALAGVPMDWPRQSGQSKSRDELMSGNWPPEITNSQPRPQKPALSIHNRTCRNQNPRTLRKRWFILRQYHLRPTPWYARISSC